MARRWVGRMTSAAEGGGGARGRGSAEPWCRGAGLAVGVGRSAWEARRWRRVGSMNEADGWRRAWMALGVALIRKNDELKSEAAAHDAFYSGRPIALPAVVGSIRRVLVSRFRWRRRLTWRGVRGGSTAVRRPWLGMGGSIRGGGWASAMRAVAVGLVSWARQGGLALGCRAGDRGRTAARGRRGAGEGWASISWAGVDDWRPAVDGKKMRS